MEKVVIVTGGTSGIGLNTARILAEKGCRVYEFSRRDTGVYPKVTHVQADVTDEAQVNIILGNVELLRGNPLGGLVVLIDGEEEKRKAVIEYLRAHDVRVEVIARG